MPIIVENKNTMSLPVGGQESQNSEKVIDRIEAEVIVSLAMIGKF